jgi:uncharacterized protein YjiS (DUF1127 family)
MTFITAQATRPSASSTTLDYAVAALRRLLREVRIRRAANELRALSPALLKDMGISRADIDRVTRLGR